MVSRTTSHRPLSNRSVAHQSAAPCVPATRRLSTLREAAATCRGCDLYRRATQTVFGDGFRHAKLMLVGEQPGDQEDRLGRPFVGPAGRLLDELLEAAGIARQTTFVTNVVKHFKWTAQGKRRLHAKPSAREVAACRPWLDAEIAAVRPRIIVCLGATAAQALLGRNFRITRQRGELLDSELAPFLMATYHPAALLRAPHAADRDRMRGEFVADLKLTARRLRDA